jgi:hypothetical protein
MSLPQGFVVRMVNGRLNTTDKSNAIAASIGIRAA